jgi:hypothetical protein
MIIRDKKTQKGPGSGPGVTPGREHSGTPPEDLKRGGPGWCSGGVDHPHPVPLYPIGAWTGEAPEGPRPGPGCGSVTQAKRPGTGSGAENDG